MKEKCEKYTVAIQTQLPLQYGAAKQRLELQKGWSPLRRNAVHNNKRAWEWLQRHERREEERRERAYAEKDGH